MKIYTIYDKKMGTYNIPIHCESIVQLQRDIQRVLKTGKGNMAEFATDYEIYYLGEYNQEFAEYTLEKKPKFEMNVSELQQEVPA